MSKVAQLAGIFLVWHAVCLGSWATLALAVWRFDTFLDSGNWWVYYMATTVIPLCVMLFIGVCVTLAACAVLFVSVCQGTFKEDFVERSKDHTKGLDHHV